MSVPMEELRMISAPSTLGVRVQLSSSVAVVESAPPELFAQTVNESDAEVTFSGVPQMLPLVVPNDRPVGRLGDISQDVTAPPVLVGVAVVISRLFEISIVEYAMLAIWSLIIIEIEVVAEPWLLVAVTV